MVTFSGRSVYCDCVYFVRQRSHRAKTRAVQNQLYARYQCSFSTGNESFLCWIRQQNQRWYILLISMLIINLQICVPHC